jgi:hypothetical protein
MFTLRKGKCPPACNNQTVIPQGETVKYLGLHFDRKLTWREHIIKKRKQLDHKTREIQWLIGKNSPLSLENKLLIYKTILKPVWTYGTVLWGCASKSNIAIIQRYQSKILRTITNAPCYVTNPNTSHWSTNPVLSHCLPGSHPQTSYYTVISPQPPCGTNATSTAQQEVKTKMDLQHDKLRRRQWTIT